MIGHEREPRRDNQASGFSKDLEIRVSPKRPEETDSFSQRKAADLTASRKGIRPRVLTYEELGRNNGNKRDGRRRTGGLLRGSGGAYPIETEVAI